MSIRSKYEWRVCFRDGVTVNVGLARGTGDACDVASIMRWGRTWAEMYDILPVQNHIAEVRKYPRGGNGFVYLRRRGR